MLLDAVIGKVIWLRTLPIFFLIVSPAVSAESQQMKYGGFYKYTLRIDCTDGPSNNNNSKHPVSVSIWTKLGQAIGDRGGHSGKYFGPWHARYPHNAWLSYELSYSSCGGIGWSEIDGFRGASGTASDSFSFGWYLLPYLYERERELGFEPSAIALQIRGDDAFYIDRVELERRYIVGASTRESGGFQWGTSGGKGWCLSTDPNDASRWSEHVDKCSPCIRFELNKSIPNGERTGPCDFLPYRHAPNMDPMLKGHLTKIRLNQGEGEFLGLSTDMLGLTVRLRKEQIGKCGPVPYSARSRPPERCTSDWAVRRVPHTSLPFESVYVFQNLCGMGDYRCTHYGRYLGATPKGRIDANRTADDGLMTRWQLQAQGEQHLLESVGKPGFYLSRDAVSLTQDLANAAYVSIKGTSATSVDIPASAKSVADTKASELKDRQDEKTPTFSYPLPPTQLKRPESQDPQRQR